MIAALVQCDVDGIRKGSHYAKSTVDLLLRGESARQRCLKIDLFSGDGVLEFQILRVQQISAIAREAGELFKRLTGGSVQRITY